jgi:DNA polymerase I-like protein with 3'-5' exonuclease and polymerase domains
MPDGVLTAAQLREVVEAYKAFDEFVIDVETVAPTKQGRLNPLRNEVFWVSLAGPGRADVIPCGHPLGERVIYDTDDETHRVNKQGKYQEHRTNPDTGREKWYDLPDQWTAPPKQLWVSEVAKGLEPLLFSERRKVGHNLKFDLRSMAKYYGGKVPPPPYGDTEIGSRLVNENFPAYDLKTCVTRAFHFKYEKIGKEVEVHPYSAAHTYSYLDAKYDWLLWLKVKRGLDREEMWDIMNLEMDLLSVIIDMEDTGIQIDIDVIQRLGREFAMEMAKDKVAIDKAAGMEVNLNANEQVADLIYDTLGHPVKELTPTGKRKTSKDVLEHYDKDPIVAKVLDYSALNKLQGTFVEGIQNWATDGQVHPSFQQVGAVSGRMSCREPNIQQVPSRTERAKQLRQVFMARPGHVLIVSDLSQIELRILAHYTQDPRLLKAYEQGISLHKLLAERIWGADYTPTQYILAKNGNFSCLYGAAPGTLVKRYGFPDIKVAKQVRDAFYDSYRRVNPWKQDVLAIARSTYRKGKVLPYVETVLGRKRRLPGLFSGVEKVRWGAERQAISSMIQGSAADIFKLGMLNLYDQLPQVNGHILMVVHDEVVVEVPEDQAEDGLMLVKQAMEQIQDPWEPDEPLVTVPLVAEAHVVQRWSEAK